MSATLAGRARVFFAVLPNAMTQRRLENAVEGLQLGAGSWTVPRRNLHLTLAFIGDIAAAQIPLLVTVGAEQRAPSFTLPFDAYEYWPKPEVIVAAARSVPPNLAVFWQRLHEALEVHRWALNAKKLRPHITLVKKVSGDPELPEFPPFEWTPREFSLIESVTTGTQSGYTVIATWPLLDSV